MSRRPTNTQKNAKGKSPRSRKKHAPIFSKVFPQVLRKKLHKKTWKWLAKIGFTAFCLLAFYGIYLDGKIRHRMDGQVWQLPAEVYAEIPRIDVKNHPSRQYVLALLREYGYQETRMLAKQADYKWQGDDLLLIRRAFPFPNKVEPQRLLRLHFQQDKLSKIDDLNTRKPIAGFSLSPKLIAMLQTEKEDRLALPLNKFPRLLIDTLLLTEDRQFFEHEGISPSSILRATAVNLWTGHKVQGGSTLTQQLVKNLFLTNERAFSRKINEALMALILDYRYSKNRILETYLNEVYLGQMGDTQIHGFALASLFYFNRPIEEIRLDQLALLVGMIKGPSLYNPWRFPEQALKRRNVVLGILQKNQMISPELYQMLSQRPLDVQTQGQWEQKYPAFMQALRRELHYRLGAKISHLSGTRIFTTLSVTQQKSAEESVLAHIQTLRDRFHQPFETAMVVVDYRTGGIKAMIGGANVQYAGFNRALDSRRQIGSLVKPAIYLTALAQPNRFALNTQLANQPLRIKQGNGKIWQPRNYDHQYSESVTLIDAITHSMNIPTINLGREVGLNNIIAIQKKMGWDNVNIPNVPSTLLGAYAISPYDVTKLYQTLANGGKHIPLITFNTVTNFNGDVLYQNTRTAQQVVPAQANFLTLFAMQNVVKNGTAQRLQSQFSHLHLAGKTGTTNQSRDSWFVGIDGKHIATLWVGLDNNQPTKLTGSSGALPIYQQYLQRTHPLPLMLPIPANIGWAGIGYNGNWQCGLPYKLPFWQTNQTPNCE